MTLLSEYSYRRILRHLVRYGEEVSPRGMKTKEITGFTYRTSDPFHLPPLGTGRKMNMRIAAAETAQLVAGVSDLIQLDTVSNGNFRRFSNNGRLLGAYGPRAYGGLQRAVTAMQEDRDTRQANVVIWRPTDGDVRQRVRDTPCTVALGFQIRKDKLNMNVHMRSNDAWLGFPYDVTMFTRLQMSVANAFGIETGIYTHFVDSFHLYEEHWEQALTIVEQDGDCDFPPAFKPAAALPHYVPSAKWACTIENARRTVLGYVRPDGLEPDRRPGWYASRLPVTLDGTLCETCRYIEPVLTCRHPHPDGLQHLNGKPVMQCVFTA